MVPQLVGLVSEGFLYSKLRTDPLFVHSPSPWHASTCPHDQRVGYDQRFLSFFLSLQLCQHCLGEAHPRQTRLTSIWKPLGLSRHLSILLQGNQSEERAANVSLLARLSAIPLILSLHCESILQGSYQATKYYFHHSTSATATRFR